MSARKISGIHSLQPDVTVQTRQASLALSPDAVTISKNGIEFRSDTAFPLWVEMTVALQSSQDDAKVNCTGVVVDCNGNKHAGYHVSMVFTGLTRQAAERLTAMAGEQRA